MTHHAISRNPTHHWAAMLLGLGSAAYLACTALRECLRKSPVSAALHPKDDAACLDAGVYGATRAAGPQSMRDGDGRRWDTVDEASDGSFPASDPPAY